MIDHAKHALDSTPSSHNGILLHEKIVQSPTMACVIGAAFSYLCGYSIHFGICIDGIDAESNVSNETCYYFISHMRELVDADADKAALLATMRTKSVEQWLQEHRVDFLFYDYSDDQIEFDHPLGPMYITNWDLISLIVFKKS